MTGKRSQKQEGRHLEENASVILPPATVKSGARFVTFADGEKNGRTSIVMINEHV